MKKILMISLCVGFILSGYAQKQKKEEIPAPAKTAFAVKFPKAQKVKWSIEKPGEFEAEFTLNGVESAALYDANGQLIETETEIKEAALPQTVKNTIAKDFAGYKINEIEQIIDSKNIVSYEMVARKGNREYELEFLTNGKLLKKDEKKKESKESVAPTSHSPSQKDHFVFTAGI
jgi:hypothetical protein